MFILRAIFWLTVLAFLLPAGGEVMRHAQEREAYSTADAGAGAQVETLPAAVYTGRGEPDGAYAADPYYTHDETALPAEPVDKLDQALRLAYAAGKAANDLMQFCERNPDVCDTAVDTASFVTAQISHYGGQAIELAERAMNDGEARPAPPAEPSVVWERVTEGERPLPLERPQRF